MDKQAAVAHLPKGHEDDRLDQHKLEQGVVGSQEVMCPKIEEQQRVQGYRVCDVVHNCDPQVPEVATQGNWSEFAALKH